MAFFERKVTRHGYAQVNERLTAHIAHADAIHAAHILHLSNRHGNMIGQAVRRAVEQRVRRTPPKPQTYKDDDERDEKGRDGIGAHKDSALPARFAIPNQRQTDEDHAGAPDVRAKVQRVRFQGLAVVFLGRAGKHSRPRKIHDDGNAHRQKRPDAGIHFFEFEKEAVNGLVNNPGTGD